MIYALALTFSLIQQSVVADPTLISTDPRQFKAVTEKPAVACLVPEENQDLALILQQGQKIQLKDLKDYTFKISSGDQTKTLDFSILPLVEKDLTKGYKVKILTTRKDPTDKSVEKYLTTPEEIQPFLDFVLLSQPTEIESGLKVSFLQPGVIGTCEAPQYDRFQRRNQTAQKKALEKHYQWKFEMVDLNGDKKTFDLSQSLAAILLQESDVEKALELDSKAQDGLCLFQRESNSLLLKLRDLKSEDPKVSAQVQQFQKFAQFLAAN